MSGDAGDGSPAGGVEVKDFQNRINVFQRQDKQQGDGVAGAWVYWSLTPHARPPEERLAFVTCLRGQVAGGEWREAEDQEVTCTAEPLCRGVKQ
ncbi:hypothetical protein E2C01_008581 [Portunus trituberculatus]|uniref:Uncharacterized protein n=1 Tax=Portunus trituberculatus TaxID=210409 RepID=A0A5B7D2R9_PORTR|nr:hypothetical protein [Portunus trituberculatus]